METTFRLKASELTADFLKTIKRLYKKHNLFITVKNADEMDATEYLLASENNRKMLEESLKSEEGYEFSSEEFDKLSDALRKGEKIDFPEMRKVKLPK